MAWAEVLSELGSQRAFCVSLRKGHKNEQFGIQTAFHLLPPRGGNKHTVQGLEPFSLPQGLDEGAGRDPSLDQVLQVSWKEPTCREEETKSGRCAALAVKT